MGHYPCYTDARCMEVDTPAQSTATVVATGESEAQPAPAPALDNPQARRTAVLCIALSQGWAEGLGRTAAAL